MPRRTIRVKSETLGRLRSYNLRGATYDDLLNDLMDDCPPERFVLEHDLRLKGEAFSEWKEVRKRLTDLPESRTE